MFFSYLLVKDRDKPVPIDEFGAHVQRMHADRDRRFEQEYNVSILRTLYKPLNNSILFLKLVIVYLSNVTALIK